jgi:hypothetical protein
MGSEYTYGGDSDATVFKREISRDADRRTQLDIESNVSNIHSATDNPLEKWDDYEAGAGQQCR